MRGMQTRGNMRWHQDALWSSKLDESIAMLVYMWRVCMRNPYSTLITLWYSSGLGFCSCIKPFFGRLRIKEKLKCFTGPPWKVCKWDYCQVILIFSRAAGLLSFYCNCWYLCFSPNAPILCCAEVIIVIVIVWIIIGIIVRWHWFSPSGVSGVISQGRKLLSQSLSQQITKATSHSGQSS